jgi:hypothetical protein
VVADTHSWNVGCVCYRSTAAAETPQHVNFQAYGLNNKKWVDDGVSVGSLFDLRSSSGAALQYRNFRSNGIFSSAGGGTIGGN